MLIVIVLVFAICWTPHLTFLLLRSFGVIPIQLDGTLKFAKTAFILMAYMNRFDRSYILTFLLHTKIIKIWIEILQLFDTIFSALNPVIYGFMSKSFRTSFRKTVCNCLGKNEDLIATQWDQVKLLVGLTSNLWHWGQFF